MDPEQLPPDVVAALDESVVRAMRVLQAARGLTLFEAKQAVDAYLASNPGHRYSPQRMRAMAKARPAGAPYVDHSQEFVTEDPVAGEPIAFESLREPVAAQCYVFLSETALCKDWFGIALKACVHAIVDTRAIEMLDEERRNAHGELSSAVLKLHAPLPSETIEALHAALARDLPSGVSFRLVRAVPWKEAALPADELSVEYFLHEFSRRGYMVPPTTTCARLVHRPTGTRCRITAHRNREWNYREALLLLASLLGERHDR